LAIGKSGNHSVGNRWVLENLVPEPPLAFEHNRDGIDSVVSGKNCFLVLGHVGAPFLIA
jgi:hypothetical protein